MQPQSMVSKARDHSWLQITILTRTVRVCVFRPRCPQVAPTLKLLLSKHPADSWQVSLGQVVPER